MGAEEVKKLALIWYKALNARDMDTIASIVSEDITLEFPGTSDQGGVHKGREHLLEFLDNVVRGVPDLKFDIQHMTANDDSVAVEWLTSGTTWSGEPYSNRGCSVIVTKDGKIVERREYVDTERSKMVKFRPK